MATAAGNDAMMPGVAPGTTTSGNVPGRAEIPPRWMFNQAQWNAARNQAYVQDESRSTLLPPHHHHNPHNHHQRHHHQRHHHQHGNVSQSSRRNSPTAGQSLSLQAQPSGAQSSHVHSNGLHDNRRLKEDDHRSHQDCGLHGHHEADLLQADDYPLYQEPENGRSSKVRRIFTHWCGWEDCYRCRLCTSQELCPGKNINHVPVCHAKCWQTSMRQHLSNRRKQEWDQAVGYECHRHPDALELPCCHRPCYFTALWRLRRPDVPGASEIVYVPCNRTLMERCRIYKLEHYVGVDQKLGGRRSKKAKPGKYSVSNGVTLKLANWYQGTKFNHDGKRLRSTMLRCGRDSTIDMH